MSSNFEKMQNDLTELEERNNKDRDFDVRLMRLTEEVGLIINQNKRIMEMLSAINDRKDIHYADNTPSEENVTIVQPEIPTVENKQEEIVSDEISENIPEEQKTETTSVLEFLRKRVIKDTKDTADTKENTEYSIGGITDKPASIAEKFENKNNSNLKTAVGMSEKFMFINDLFLGDITEYSAFIDELNAQVSLDDAMKYIGVFQDKKKWAKGSLAYTTLENLLKKRFE